MALYFLCTLYVSLLLASFVSSWCHWPLPTLLPVQKFAGHTNQVKQLCCVEQEEEGSFLFFSLAEEDRAILLW